MKGCKWKLSVLLGGWFFCRALPFQHQPDSWLLWNTLASFKEDVRVCMNILSTPHPWKGKKCQEKGRREEIKVLILESALLFYLPKTGYEERSHKETIESGCCSFAEWFRCQRRKKKISFSFCLLLSLSHSLYQSNIVLFASRKSHQQ